MMQYNRYIEPKFIMNDISFDLLKHHIFPHLSIHEIRETCLCDRRLAQLYPQISNRVREKIYYIFRKEQVLHPVLEIILGSGVIAGGFMLHLLGFSVFNTISDMDVYLKKESLLKILDYLKSIQYSQITTISADRYFNWKSRLGKDQISILNIVNKTLPIQLIYQEFNSPFDIITAFDLDYVQCAAYQGSIYRTKDCYQSHLTRKINYIYVNPDKSLTVDRFQKAIKKGFSAPIFGDKKPPIYEKTIDIGSSKLLDALAPFAPIKPTKRLDLNSLEIVQIKRDHEFPSKNSGKYLVRCNSELFETDIIAVKIKIIEVNLIRQVIIEPIEFGCFRINFALAACEDWCKLEDDHTYIVLADIKWSEKHSRVFLRFKDFYAETDLILIPKVAALLTIV